MRTMRTEEPWAIPAGIFYTIRAKLPNASKLPAEPLFFLRHWSHFA